MEVSQASSENPSEGARELRRRDGLGHFLASKLVGAPGAHCPVGREASVRTTLLLAAIVWLSDSIVYGALFDVYVSDVCIRQGLSKPDQFVGLVETVRGLVSVLFALPLGFLADRYDRLLVLRIIVLVFGALDVALITTSIVTESLSLILVGIAAHAVFFQSLTGTCEALLADLVKRGAERTRSYAMYRTICNLTRACGPFLQASLLTGFGDEVAVKAILLGGLLLIIPAVVILWPMRLPALTEGIAGSLLTASRGSGSASAIASEEVEHVDRFAGIPKHVLVPGLIVTFNIIFMLAAGMTLKFYPLFYHSPYEYGLSERNVCLVMGGFWICTSLGSHLGGLLVGKCRRTVTVLVAFTLGTTGLFAWIAARPLWLSLTMFLLRTLVVTVPFVFNTALIMDYALTKHRGKWAAVSSLNRGIWAGSAVVGGSLIDRFRYRTTFSVTGYIFIISGAVYAPLLCILPND